MPRAPRIEYAGALYHVTSRGNGRANIFLSDDDRRRFLLQLRDNLDTFECVLYAYVLMDNHYHLLVRTCHPNLSRFMQRLNTSYALYARYKHRKPGHQLQGRYKAKVVDDQNYLLALTRYIHVNPVKTKTAERLPVAQRIAELERYSWSSLPGYIEARKANEWICYDVLKIYGGGSGRDARRRYRAYMRSSVAQSDEPLRDLLEDNAYAVGEPEFVASIERRIQKKRKGDARDSDLRLPRSSVGFDSVDEVVATTFNVPRELLGRHGRSVGEAKTAAIELACRLTGVTQREVGAHYGGISSAAVSITRRRVREAPPRSTLRKKILAMERSLLNT